MVLIIEHRRVERRRLHAELEGFGADERDNAAWVDGLCSGDAPSRTLVVGAGSRFFPVRPKPEE